MLQELLIFGENDKRYVYLQEYINIQSIINNALQHAMWDVILYSYPLSYQIVNRMILSETQYLTKP